jgi:hypothetical protein
MWVLNYLKTYETHKIDLLNEENKSIFVDKIGWREMKWEEEIEDFFIYERSAKINLEIPIRLLEKENPQNTIFNKIIRKLQKIEEERGEKIFRIETGEKGVGEIQYLIVYNDKKYDELPILKIEYVEIEENKKPCVEEELEKRGKTFLITDLSYGYDEDEDYSFQICNIKEFIKMLELSPALYYNCKEPNIPACQNLHAYDYDTIEFEDDDEYKKIAAKILERGEIYEEDCQRFGCNPEEIKEKAMKNISKAFRFKFSWYRDICHSDCLCYILIPII